MRSAAFENEAVVCSGGVGGGHGGLWKPAEPGLCWREGGGAPLEIPSPLTIDRNPGLLGNKSHLSQNVSIFPEKCYYLTARSL